MAKKLRMGSVLYTSSLDEAPASVLVFQLSFGCWRRYLTRHTRKRSSQSPLFSTTHVRCFISLRAVFCILYSSECPWHGERSRMGPHLSARPSTRGTGYWDDRLSLGRCQGVSFLAAYGLWKLRNGPNGWHPSQRHGQTPSSLNLRLPSTSLVLAGKWAGRVLVEHAPQLRVATLCRKRNVGRPGCRRIN